MAAAGERPVRPRRRRATTSELARIAERGKLDSVFFADSPVLWGDVGRRPAGALEPTVLLTAIAGVDRAGSG